MVPGISSDQASSVTCSEARFDHQDYGQCDDRLAQANPTAARSTTRGHKGPRQQRPEPSQMFVDAAAFGAEPKVSGSAADHTKVSRVYDIWNIPGIMAGDVIAVACAGCRRRLSRLSWQCRELGEARPCSMRRNDPRF